MIANTEINETGKIFLSPFFGLPDYFFKEPVTTFPLSFFWKFCCPFRKRVGG